ncbi:hypothetical protein [Labedaea rhizosphaerae]|uniref:Outer membrane lipoprotein-sorting protein n=1 Tax=Labedaea rhizosphaerae TaxID=598644 RepID=A0A4R6SGX7_LABRH|nr:hypothetical protein [Labedaea rhizosphaerae]TDQ00178.1 hypothetical protein EV186_10239 [Labedaea rhizosphaerae]
MAARVVRRAAQRRWALVVVLAAVLVSIPAVVTALSGQATAKADPAALRALVARSASVPYQGYVESTGSMGVPDLPRLADLSSLLSGTTRTRVWYRNPSSYRYAVLTIAGERDVYHGALGETTWDYESDMLTEVVGEAPLRVPRAGDLLPPELARRIISATATDPVTPLPPRVVAGVDAAGFRLVPADPDTTVGAVDIWADPASGLPVRVEVGAKGKTRPIMVTQFLELDRAAPPTSVTRPQRSPGAGYTIVSVEDLAGVLGAFSRFPQQPVLAGRVLRQTEVGGVHGVGLYGTGLASFVVAAVPRSIGDPLSESATQAGAAKGEVTDGTALTLSIPPLTMVIARSTLTRRYFLLAGLIDARVLRDAAGQLTSLLRGRR